MVPNGFHLEKTVTMLSTQGILIESLVPLINDLICSVT